MLRGTPGAGRPSPVLFALPFLYAALAAGLAPRAARADVPYPTCEAAGCEDPADFGAYLFLEPGALPDDYDPNSGEAWKYAPGSGMDIVGAWRRTTGRPDVVIAVLDSGIYWDRADLARKVALNAGELPVPEGCQSRDCNGDGFVSVDDFAAACAADPNGNGHCDGQDLIRFYGDGVDDDGNGFVDDIAGWDFSDDDNDAEDQVRYGHGTGEASDEVAEADNGFGFPGFAPSALFVPLRVADSFVGFDQDFARAVVYAVDRRVDVISEALGTVNATPTGQAAVDYAYRNGIPLIASAADEESRHHNLPAAYEHTIWVNSIRDGDGVFLDADANGYDMLNGCTNYGGRAWVAIPSAACSSEATSRAGGLTALLISHARNRIDAGAFAPYPGLDTPFSAEEVRQLLRAAARDVDHADDASVVPGAAAGLLSGLLSAFQRGLVFGSSRFPTLPGWDQFTGYGRPDAVALLDLVTPDTIPPEVDLSGSLRWFDTLDPARTPEVEVVASVRAARADHRFSWILDVGCGVQPTEYHEIASGEADGPVEAGTLASWRPGDTAAACGFDPAVPVASPDDHTVTVRLRALDAKGNLGEDRRTVAVHGDATLRFPPRFIGASGEGAPTLADVDRDGVLDVVHAAADGTVRVFDGATGADLPGFPAFTRELDVHPSPAYESGAVPVPREGVIGSVAADDLDGDGRVEIVVAGIEGGLYVFDDGGALRPGFPVGTDPALSAGENRDPLNDTDPGIVGAPTLADLDGDGALEIVHSALDGHLYAWRADGAAVAGFPVRLADRERVEIDPETGRATPRGPGVRSRAAKSLSSPAVGDLDGDGRPEIVVATNEEYDDEPDGFAIESTLFSQFALVLGAADVDTFSLDTQGRVYAVRPEGDAHPDGPFLSGWPAPVPLLTPGVLPDVGTGTPGSPALADTRGDGRLQVAIFGAIGPVLLLEADGSPALGTIDGLRRALAIDFAGGGFPNIPETAGSPDAPFFAALGAGAFGDMTGDGLPEYVAPTGGLRKLIDVVVTAAQGKVAEDPTAPVEDGLADHQITAWDPRSGATLPAFPRRMDDMQFLASPTLADVDGDGRAEVVQGSGAYLVRAYRADGSTPDGWPKFTHGWHIASPSPGDVDGDGLIEVVAITREGNVFVWDTPAPATEAALPWAGFGRDRRNTQNLASGVSRLAPPVDPDTALENELRALESELGEAFAAASGRASRELRAAQAAAANARRAVAGGRAGSREALLAVLDAHLERIGWAPRAAADPEDAAR